MAVIQVEAHQYFSRDSLSQNAPWTFNVPSKAFPEIIYSARVDYQLKAINLGFADFQGRRPSAGAFQHQDSFVDAYFSKRWPSCAVFSGQISLPDSELPLPNKRRQELLVGFMDSMWIQNLNLIPADQRATIKGYRRNFFHEQNLDIMRNRRPNDGMNFQPTEVNEPIGPGFVFLDVPHLNGEINELVWSPILPLAFQKGGNSDLKDINRVLRSLRKHYNGYDELNVAQSCMDRGDFKSAIRAAASAVDAYLRHLVDSCNGRISPQKIPFDQKLDNALISIGRPSFRSVEPESATHLRHLYRARNSMHEGDCYYDDDSKKRFYITNASQAETLINAAQGFVLWADSLV